MSNRFGSGTGSDFSAVADEYSAFARWCAAHSEHTTKTPSEQLQQLVVEFGATQLPERLASTPGLKNRVQNAYLAILELLQSGRSPTENFSELAELANKAAAEKRGKVGAKGSRPWAAEMLRDVEAACRMTYASTETEAAKHWEFAVMLDHAARRICQSHSWIKLAETNRRQFEADARRLGNVPDDARRWLDEYCSDRTGDSGALEEYRIRKSALGGWKEIVQRWQRATCQSREDRIEAAREVKADPDLKKFGDIQLFESLAADDARVVWQINGEPTTKPLADYVAATDAAAKRVRFKVPAYRHPDALRHPVFCDFGNSRWSIGFAVHQRRQELPKKLEAIARAESNVAKLLTTLEKAKTPEKQQAAEQKLDDARKKLDAAQCEAAWLQSSRGLRMQLWNGKALGETALRWSSKRLSTDLAMRQAVGEETELIEVGRADRLGRAAAGTDSTHAVTIAGIFDLDHWNGRLQAPRRQLDDLADIRDGMKGKWKDKSQAERDTEVRKRIGRIN